jgi:hypothetical protein
MLTPVWLPNLHDDKPLCNGWQEFHDGGNFFLTAKTAQSYLMAGLKPLRRCPL